MRNPCAQPGLIPDLLASIIQLHRRQPNLRPATLDQNIRPGSFDKHLAVQVPREMRKLKVSRGGIAEIADARRRREGANGAGTFAVVRGYGPSSSAWVAGEGGGNAEFSCVETGCGGVGGLGDGGIGAGYGTGGKNGCKGHGGEESEKEGVEKRHFQYEEQFFYQLVDKAK